jgi:hypothetical protein
MSHGRFVVPLHDLEAGPREVSWTLDEAWLLGVLDGVDAKPLGDGKVEVRISKNGRDVLVRGRAEVRITAADCRSLDPVELLLEPDIFLMLSPAPTAVERAPRRPKRKRRASAAEGEKKRGAPKWSEDPELSADLAGRDTYQGEQVVLDDYFREFLLLDLPMVVRKDLNSEPAPAIAPPSAEPVRPLDPRLAPLAAIAERLRGRKD